MLSYQQEKNLWLEKKHCIFQQINRSGKPLVLFGYSSAINLNFINSFDVELKYIMDNDFQKRGKSYCGLKVISPDQCPYQTYNVLILVPFEEDIRKQLSSLAIKPSLVFVLDLYFECKNTSEYYESHEKEIQEICSSLSDNLSQETFNQIIRYRINRDKQYLNNVALPRYEQYFPKSLGGVTILSENETFIDAGAYNGDTINLFCRAVNNNYFAIYAFEPDAGNFLKLKDMTSSKQNIQCFNAGIGNCEKVVAFESDASSSRIKKGGTEHIRIVALDDVLSNIPITFLKMDVEGMEMEALQGSEQIIRTHKPKLAICTYHLDAHMIEVPQLIWKLNPDYKIYFRHYSTGVVETVCYAI